MKKEWALDMKGLENKKSPMPVRGVGEGACDYGTWCLIPRASFRLPVR